MGRSTDGAGATIRREGRGFAVGLVAGLLLAASAAAVADETSGVRDFARTTLYAVVELAIDTETNATRIAALDERIDDLELRLDALTGARE